MKGKGNYRFIMPNVQRLRSRIEKPSADLSSKLRTKLQEVAAEVLNSNSLVIKAKMIDYVVNELGIEFKNEQHEKSVTDLTGAIFDTYFGATPQALAEISGIAEDAPEAEEEEETTEEAAPAKKTAPAKKAEAVEDTKEEAKAAPAKKADVPDDEFE